MVMQAGQLLRPEVARIDGQGEGLFSHTLSRRSGEHAYIKQTDYEQNVRSDITGHGPESVIGSEVQFLPP
jgi:hypothetical protein